MFHKRAPCPAAILYRCNADQESSSSNYQAHTLSYCLHAFAYILYSTCIYVKIMCAYDTSLLHYSYMHERCNHPVYSIQTFTLTYVPSLHKRKGLVIRRWIMRVMPAARHHADVETAVTISSRPCVVSLSLPEALYAR